MGYMLSAACECNVGKFRQNNEDNFYFNGYVLPEQNSGTERTLTYTCDFTDNAVDFAVFDGMGGHADGQTASYLAGSVFANLLESGSSNEEVLRQSVKAMSDTIAQRAKSEYSNMGTTAVILRVTPDGGYLANVGDSRAYRFRKGALTQVSHDHTDEALMKSLGVMNRKPRLTQYVGLSPEEMIVDPYIAELQIARGDQYLLCSDGLTDMVSEDEIATVLGKASDVSRKVRELVKLALEHGGMDNVTVILVEIDRYPATTAAPDRSTGTAEYGKGGQNTLKKVLFIIVLVLVAALACAGTWFLLSRKHKEGGGENAAPATADTASTMKETEPEEQEEQKKPVAEPPAEERNKIEDAVPGMTAPKENENEPGEEGEDTGDEPEEETTEAGDNNAGGKVSPQTPGNIAPVPGNPVPGQGEGGINGESPGTGDGGTGEETPGTGDEGTNDRPGNGIFITG